MTVIPQNSPSTVGFSSLPIIACPECHAKIPLIGGDQNICTSCQHRLLIRDGVIFAGPSDAPSFFDERFEIMQAGNREPGVWSFCYEQQIEYLGNALGQDSVFIDVGCGPELVYEKRSNWRVIGVDPSLPSLKANPALDLRIHGAARRMPVATESVDAVVCFYSVHHMVSETVAGTTENVRSAMKEFRRVVRRGGSIIVFDMSPWWPFWIAQRVAWNGARKILGDRLDMYFWRSTALQTLVASEMKGCTLVSKNFKSSWSTTFPPIFSLPSFRVPRALYPLEPWLYHWVTH